MKTNLKKLLSIALAVAFVLTMIPFAGVSVAAADATVSYADGVYEINAGTGGSATVIGNPVSIIPYGQTASVSFDTIWKYTSTTGVATFGGQDWHNVYFSNDPTFTTSANISAVRVADHFHPHVLGGTTTIQCTNFLSNGINNWGARYTWTFNVVGSQVLLTIQHGNGGPNLGGQYALDFSGVIEVGKPIYMRINSPDMSRYGEGFAMYYQTIVREADVNAAIAEAEVIDKAKADAAAFDAKVNALPAASELVYCDKGNIAAARAEYDALSDAAKTYVTKLAALEALEAAAADLVEDNLYRAADGKLYYVRYNKEYVTLGSDVDGAVITEAPTVQNTKDSSLSVVTKDKYPVLTTEYALQCYFGTHGATWFGMASSFENAGATSLTNNFKMIRTESANTTKLKVIINGKETECASFIATRTRLAYISVVKKNGSYYLNYDGHIVDGAAYSAEVQEACKLENYFPENFLANNASVHFYYGADSMYSRSYFKVLTETVDNVILNESNTINGDRNGIVDVPASITFRPEISVTKSLYTDGSSIYSIKSKGGSAIIGTPIPEAGFTFNGNMVAGASHQFINYYISNDPTFKDGSHMLIQIVQFPSSNYCHIIVNGATVGDFYNFYQGAHYHAEINQNILSLRSDRTYNIADVSAYVGKPMYLKVEGITNGDLNMNVIYKDGGAAYNGLDTSVLALAKESADSLDYAALMEIVNTFTAENPINYDNKALALIDELITIAENKLMSAADLIEEEVSNVYAASTDWVLSAEAIKALETEANGNRYFDDDKMTEIVDYINGLADASADELVNLKKGLLDVMEIDLSYDYYRDSENNILDFIRMKNLAGKNQ